MLHRTRCLIVGIGAVFVAPLLLAQAPPRSTSYERCVEAHPPGVLHHDGIRVSFDEQLTPAPILTNLVDHPPHVVAVQNGVNNTCGRLHLSKILNYQTTHSYRVGVLFGLQQQIGAEAGILVATLTGAANAMVQFNGEWTNTDTHTASDGADLELLPCEQSQIVAELSTSTATGMYVSAIAHGRCVLPDLEGEPYYEPSDWTCGGTLYTGSADGVRSFVVTANPTGDLNEKCVCRCRRIWSLLQEAGMDGKLSEEQFDVLASALELILDLECKE